MLTTRQMQSSESRENKQWLQELSAQECSGGWIEGNGGFFDEEFVAVESISI